MRVDEDIGLVRCGLAVCEVEIVDKVASVFKSVAKGGKIGATSARPVGPVGLVMKARGQRE